MTNLDQFESVFRAAERSIFRYRPPSIESVLIVSDLPADEAGAFEAGVRGMVESVCAEPPQWSMLRGESIASIGELVEQVETRAPDLLCTYRHLHSEAWRWPYGLGEYLDVLTQASRPAVLVLPHPRTPAGDRKISDLETVMLITDHLDGSEGPVNAAARYTKTGGTLWLAHIEDEVAFEHLMVAVAQTPEIDTDLARTELRERLLKNPRDYVSVCRKVLGQARADIAVELEVTMGHHLSTYRRLVETHHVDLLVMNTKDEDQLAMHGMAYPLAVELREIALLLL